MPARRRCTFWLASLSVIAALALLILIPLSSFDDVVLFDQPDAHKVYVTHGVIWFLWQDAVSFMIGSGTWDPLLHQPPWWQPVGFSLAPGWGSRYVYVRAWAPAAPLLAIAAVLFRRLIPKTGYCARCNYNLTANTSGVCPECGAPIPTPRQLT